MSDTGDSQSDPVFSPAIEAVQRANGTRDVMARMVARRPWPDRISPALAAFIGSRTSVFFGSASADGQPYIQHRGGPPGFLKVLGERRLAFADFSGNGQYITAGNLSENAKAFLFLIDYPLRRRVKLWGRASVVEGDRALEDRLRPPDIRARVERVILFDLTAWDENCPQFIPSGF